MHDSIAFSRVLTMEQMSHLSHVQPKVDQLMLQRLAPGVFIYSWQAGLKIS